MYVSVTEVAHEIGCRPRDISDAFYSQVLDESRVIRLGNRRAIPAEYVPEIRRILAERGKIREQDEA